MANKSNAIKKKKNGNIEKSENSKMFVEKKINSLIFKYLM